MDRRDLSETVRATGEYAYFAASNSAQGFRSYYPDCFDREEIDRLYAVKGGPGTGKSRFMREVAECAEQVGWGTEMIYCSSDPDSLDGVILTRGKERVALLDATAPHVYEPSRPGFREEIVNLGAFWDAEYLRAHREEIERLNEKKSEAYRRAYRYLAGYGEVSSNREELVTPYLKRRAISDFAGKLLQGIPDGQTFRVQTALMRSVGMRGTVGFDTYFAQANKIFLIEDCRGSAFVLMRELYRAAAEKQLDVRVSRDPILPDNVDGLFLNQSGVVFAVCAPEQCDYPFRKISMRRFVRTDEMRDVREAVNYAERMRRAMLGGALEELRRVCDIHFQIEEIYIVAMDFTAKEEFTKSFCNRLFHLQNE